MEHDRHLHEFKLKTTLHSFAHDPHGLGMTRDASLCPFSVSVLIVFFFMTIKCHSCLTEFTASDFRF